MASFSVLPFVAAKCDITDSSSTNNKEDDKNNKDENKNKPDINNNTNTNSVNRDDNQDGSSIQSENNQGNQGSGEESNNSEATPNSEDGSSNESRGAIALEKKCLRWMMKLLLLICQQNMRPLALPKQLKALDHLKVLNQQTMETMALKEAELKELHLEMEIALIVENNLWEMILVLQIMKQRLLNLSQKRNWKFYTLFLMGVEILKRN
ncbi:Pseudogene of Hypothetical protein (N terminalpart) [Mycoplasmopsis agalactiae PG2]|uniref:Uncharacterized protein n=1 Tax=Mycoplasmopsis agalactiae (strain NCTC 10123 / CIP 59.7 / PG2) TaxID=347257 RepID=A5IYL9_MYCAP|nr:Pseudogene of Hypothetical protein (N terminalpart) [Mycoplasmopsis agalactiae PG2]